jgi:hypothetical protein
MARFRRSSKARLRARTASRQPVAIIAIALALAFGAFAADKFATAQRQAAAQRQGLTQGTAQSVAPPDVQEIYTGSILYMPDDGRICRQLLFDNHNGRFSDNGYVDCEAAAYRGALDVPKQWSPARLHVISAGFFRH